MRFLLIEIIVLATTVGCGNVVVGTGSSSTSSTSAAGGAGGGLAAGQCRSTSDCAASYDVCVPPTGWTGCGGPACPSLPPCTGDADCAAQGATFICMELPCCGAQACVAGCTSDAACATGETCTSGHHCAPTACTSNGDCPVDFDCDSSACQRRPCADDAVCSGYCVLGSCYEAPGTCSAPPV